MSIDTYIFKDKAMVVAQVSERGVVTVKVPIDSVIFLIVSKQGLQISGEYSFVSVTSSRSSTQTPRANYAQHKDKQ
jgi:hypothetical protein